MLSAQQASKESRAENLALVAIAKNEAPYLLEWIAFHRSIGFDRIRIYSNDSSDQSEELLSLLSLRYPWFEYKIWPRTGEARPQHSAYLDAHVELAKDFDWVMFLDLDEFLVMKKHERVHELVAEYREFDAVAFNWRTFGGGGQVNYEPEFVTRRFTDASAADAKINRCVKSIVRPRAMRAPNIHVHYMQPGSRYVFSDGHPLDEICFTSAPDKHILDDYCHIAVDTAQINHYHLKSKAEYGRKLVKGRATKPAADADAKHKGHLPASWEEYDRRGLSVLPDDSIGRFLGDTQALFDEFVNEIIGNPPEVPHMILSRFDVFSTSAGGDSEDAVLVGDLPWMPQAEVDFLRESLAGVGCFLEYGCGGSSALACRAGVKTVVSVESDQKWLDAVTTKVRANYLNTDFKPMHIDIGPTGKFGYPVRRDLARNFPSYAVRCWDFVNESSLSPELILIDGRFRVACFLASLAFADAGARILFDDYGDRPWYRVVEELIQPSELVGRMASFVVPQKLDYRALIKLLSRHLNEPN